MGPFWHYFRVIVAVKVKLGAFSTILWPLVLFGGYLEAVSTRSFRSFQRPYEDILAQMCHSGDIWGLSGSFGSIGANFGAIYVFNRLFGAMGVNGGSQELKNIWGHITGILGLFWHYFGVIVAAPSKLGAPSTILWLSVLFGGYLGAVSAIWRSLVLFGCDGDFWGS